MVPKKGPKWSDCPFNIQQDWENKCLEKLITLLTIIHISPPPLADLVKERHVKNAPIVRAGHYLHLGLRGQTWGTEQQQLSFITLGKQRVIQEEG